MKLSDKTVVIVGGSQGIGRALAERFINEVSNVVSRDIVKLVRLQDL